MAPRTLPQLFEDSVKAFPGNVYMWEKRGDRRQGTTYADMRTLVREFAAGLMSVPALAKNFRRGIEKAIRDKGPKVEKLFRRALKLLGGEIDAYRTGGRFEGLFPQRWLPAAVAVLGEGFTEQNRLLNSTLKIVRGRIADFYKNRIDFLFTPEAKDICNHQNLNIVSRFE